MTETFSVGVFLTQMQCGKCAGVFALTQEFLNHARSMARGYHCPYCQETWRFIESDVQRLTKQLEEKSRALVAAKCETLKERQLRESEQKQRESAEKKLRRVNAGVCPCCNRSFTNLARHMATKHKNQ